MYIKTDGIVLREVAYQDSDKLLTVLTREYGKLTVRARGVRSSRSRSKAACQLLAYSEFTLLERGGRYVVTEATAKEMFPELRNDLELLSLASYFAQAADVLSPEGEENPPFVSLLLNALYALGRLGLPQKLVKAVFELRAMCLAGYEPLLDGCAVCGSEPPEEPRFHLREGVLHCARCRDEVGEGISMPHGGRERHPSSHECRDTRRPALSGLRAIFARILVPACGAVALRAGADHGELSLHAIGARLFHAGFL